MKAAVLHAPRTPLVVENIELDTDLRANEVMVRVTHAGVCHSDYHIMTGDLPYSLPVVLGHEGAGII